MKISIWSLWLCWWSWILGTRAYPVQKELGQRLQIAQAKFDNFFESLAKAPYKTLDYANSVGTAQDHPTNYPGTVYARFQHLKRSYEALPDVAKADLSSEVVEAMNKALGEVAASSQPSLISVLMALADYVGKERTYSNHLQYWLGQSPTCPKGALPLSLPEAFDNVLRPLFEPWRKAVTYSQNPTEKNNLFSLAHQISNEVAKKTAEEQKRVETWLGPLGTPEEDNPQTLFGQIIALQRLVESTEEDNLPFPLAHFQRLLGSPKGLIVKSLSESLAFLQGQRVTRPQQTPRELMASLNHLPRQTLQNIFVTVPKLWPPRKGGESIQQRLQSIAFRFEELGYVQKSSEWYEIRATLGLLSKKSYAYGSLLDAVSTLSSLIAQPSLPFDESDFEDVAPFIGLEGRPSSTTLWGLLETISQRLEKTSEIDEKDILRLLGAPKDPLKRPGEETTVWGVLKALIEHFLLKAPFPGQKLQDLAWRIMVREDLPLSLKSLLGDNKPTTLIHRLKQLEKDMQDLIDQHQFGWADQLFEALSRHVPALEKALQDVLVAPASELEALLSQAWWRSDGIFQDLNALLEVVRGGGAQKLFRPKNLPSYGDSQRLSLRTFDWYRKEWKVLMKREPLKGTNLALRLGLSERKEDSVSLEPFQALWERLTFLSDMIPMVALQEPIDSEEATWKSWMQNIVDTKQGLMGLCYLFTVDLDTFSLGQAEAESSLLWERIEQAVEGIYPRVGTLSALLQNLLEEGFRTFLRRSVASHRAQRYGWFLQDGDSLRHALQEVQEMLLSENDPQVFKALRRLGTEADGPFSPTIFGQLTACEDLLFRLWEERLRIPLQACSQVAACLAEKLWTLRQEGWTQVTAAQLGEFLSSPSEDSVSGLLNLWRAHVLAGPLQRGLETALSMTRELAKTVATHPALKIPDRLRVLSSILPPKEMARWSFFTEELEGVAFDEDDKFATLSQGLSFLLEALEPVKGCLYVNHAQQWGRLVSSLLVSLRQLQSEFDAAKKAFDPGIPIYKPALADKALARLGQESDRAETPLPGLSSTSPTLRGLVHELALRFHSLYTSLHSWLTSETLKNIDKHLTTLEQSLTPNSTALTPYLRGCDRCSNFFSSCTALLAGAGEWACEPLEKKEYYQQKRDLFQALCETLWGLQPPAERLAHVLPRLWGQGMDQQAVDLYPFWDDVVESILSCIGEADRLLVLLNPHAVVPSGQHDQRSSSSLEEALQNVVRALRQCTQALTRRVQNASTTPSYASDLAETGLDLFRCSLALSGTCSPYEDIANELRLQVTRGEVELAPVVMCVNQYVLALRELEKALVYGGQVLSLQAEQQPLQLAHAVLRQAFSSSQPQSFADQVAGLQEGAGSKTDSHGPSIFTPNSLMGLAESRRQSLGKILPQYLEYAPEVLAELVGKKFPL